MQKAILEVGNLSTFFRQNNQRTCVVKEVSFSLFAHKTLALVGESGCGKSMTALSIMKILPHNRKFELEGNIFFEGTNLIDAAESKMRQIRGKKIAMVFQDPSSALNPVFSVGDQLAEMFVFHENCSQQESEEKAVEMLKKVGIPRAEHCFDTYPHQLSGGMKQRVMLAIALSCRPSVLIADEPTTALDVTVQKEILKMLKDFQKAEEMAILLITHDMGVVAEMADDVAVMYASEIVELGTTKEVFDQLYHPYTKGLFQSRPQTTPKGHKLPTIQGMVPPLTRLPSGCHFHPRCPSVMDKCFKNNVPEYRLHSKINACGHRVRCFLYESTENSPIIQKV